MTKRRTAELVAGKHVRTVTAHPDDSLWYSSIIPESGYADEALLTAGRRGKDLRPNNKRAFSVEGGYRTQEEAAAAHILRLRHVLFYPGRDGKLAEDTERLIPQIGAEAAHHGVDILVGNALVDHPDHRAAGDIAIGAAQRAAELGRPIGVLLIHHNLNEGDYISEATPETMQRTFTAASKHVSQWRMKVGDHKNWPSVPGGFSIHPDDLASLELYPLRRDASYTWIPAEQLAANAGELPEMRYTRVQI